MIDTAYRAHPSGSMPPWETDALARGHGAQGRRASGATP